MLTQVERIRIPRYPIFGFEVVGGTSYDDARRRRIAADDCVDDISAVAGRLPRLFVPREGAVYCRGDADRLADVALVALKESGGRPVAVDMGVDGFVVKTARVEEEPDFTTKGTYVGWRIAFDDGSDAWYRSRELAEVMLDKVYLPAWRAGGRFPYCIIREINQPRPVSGRVSVEERLSMTACVDGARCEPWHRYLFCWIEGKVV